MIGLAGITYLCLQLGVDRITIDSRTPRMGSKEKREFLKGWDAKQGTWNMASFKTLLL